MRMQILFKEYLIQSLPATNFTCGNVAREKRDSSWKIWMWEEGTGTRSEYQYWARQASQVVLVGKESCQCRRWKRRGFDPWVWKIPWRRKRLPTPVFLLGNPMDGGAWRVTVHRVTKSWTQQSDLAHICYLFNLLHSFWDPNGKKRKSESQSS